MSKIDTYRAVLAGLDEWMPYLNANSGLPGPRGNLELVAACAEEATADRARGLIDSGDEFATVCGLVALGRHLGGGETKLEPVLHEYASDPRWRVREGVAMALQRAADEDPAGTFAIAENWVMDDDPLVRRAAVAAVCEPRLLRLPEFAVRALALVDRATESLAQTPQTDRRSPAVRVLRKALGYGWSVAIAALPEAGLAAFRALESSDDRDVCWVVAENRKKARFKRLMAPT